MYSMPPHNYIFRLSIKSKLGAEYRRYSISLIDPRNSFDLIHQKIRSVHRLNEIPFDIYYKDSEGFLLPINNNDNLARAINAAKNYSKIKFLFLRIFFDQGYLNELARYNTGKDFSSLRLPEKENNHLRPSISSPGDFRQVSSIIDADVLPQSCRRVRIKKHPSDNKPLGFFIREGTYRRMDAQGQIKLIKGIFISRIVPGALADHTGLLAENDEVLEVNGIQVTNHKTLEQVTEMMNANSYNLIMTIRPHGKAFKRM